MKFSIMYLAGKFNGKMDGYRQLPSTVLSEDTRKKVEEEIEAYIEAYKKSIEPFNLPRGAKGVSNDLQ